MWGRWRRRRGQGSHPIEMLLGELKVAAGGMGVGAPARLIELGQGATRMIADLVVHGFILIPARPGPARHDSINLLSSL